MEKGNRLENLDILKVYAILTVVTLHVPLWSVDFINGTYKEMLQYAFRLICEGVPFFVVINGFLLFRKDSFNLKKHISKMKHIALVFVIWAVIDILVGMAVSPNKELINIESIVFYVLNTKVNSDYTGSLWFLQKLFAIYLIFPGLYYIYKNFYNIFRFLFCVITFFVLGLSTLVLLRDYCYAISGTETKYLPMILSFINEVNPIENGEFVLYFCLGGILWKNINFLLKYKKRILFLAIISWPLAFGFSYFISMKLGETYNPGFNYNSPFMIVMISGLIVGTMNYQFKLKVCRSLIESISKNIFGIYLSHFLFVFIINSMWIRYSFKDRLCAYTVVFISAYIFSVIISHIPYVNRLIKI